MLAMVHMATLKLSDFIGLVVYIFLDSLERLEPRFVSDSVEVKLV